MSSQHAIMYIQAYMLYTHLSAQFTLSQDAHKESVVYTKSGTIIMYNDVCVHNYYIIITLKMKQPAVTHHSYR